MEKDDMTVTVNAPEAQDYIGVEINGEVFLFIILRMQGNMHPQCPL